ncbi:UDP-N-acetylglucosamine 1-carboxyvinyltransferase [Buchnera aphidicola (Hyadaphis tataricae)]|uniref:UDP-N-acetylglucosamine 1-carboxyvinyltransferase n=1 Tax=Buchnera aphidicola (Hyadaphis tataricae) TaxID=1241859 RepID=A0A4D6XZF6_9GAMM|nr:UDP-N-acetylglucosamine 1-carboxyvinyltransferase [Buchnera aphidicola]QCI21677.1 UDP-N-acetylglucosamine 1-carboxyvinyltransferase [Buchnera aphidicola (Hyadaphis tataricae)]
MTKLYVTGNKNLNGHVIISGSKNAALPIIFMSILTDKAISIKNVPDLKDINIALRILICLGARVTFEKVLYIDPSLINNFSAPYHLIKEIRASIWILAPLLTRFGKAKIFFPGGCNIGARPIDLHIKYLTQLGAKITIKNDCITASIKGRFKGQYVLMEKISVGATITLISAAVLAEGLTIIDNAAQEPEIVDIAKFLNNLGANITGAGSNKIYVLGVSQLKGNEHKIIPDRIETGTFLVAAAISKGCIICHKTQPQHLEKVLIKLNESGAKISTGKNWIKLDMRETRPQSLNICTKPYPGFPTDMQAQFALLNVVAKGNGSITETIFESRFHYVTELIKMGARIKIQNSTIQCYEIQSLSCAQVFCSDLRASATLILAGCIASGITIVDKIDYLIRGYESFTKKLNQLGADIKMM